MPYCLRSKILSMAHLTCGMVVVPKPCVSVYDMLPCSEAHCHRAECDVLLLSMVTHGGKTPYMPTDALERMGYEIIIFASDVQCGAIFGMRRPRQELRTQAPVSFIPQPWVCRNARALSTLTTTSNHRNAICVWMSGMEE